MFNNRAEAKANGWFSRRHSSRDAHDAAVEAYKNKTNENHANPDGPTIEDIRNEMRLAFQQ